MFAHISIRSLSPILRITSSPMDKVNEGKESSSASEPKGRALGWVRYNYVQDLGRWTSKGEREKRERDTLATVAQTCVKVHIRRPLELRDSLVYSKADEKLMMDKAGCTLCQSTSRSVCPVTIELSIDKTQQLSVPQKTLSLSISLHFSFSPPPPSTCDFLCWTGLSRTLSYSSLALLKSQPGKIIEV